MALLTANVELDNLPGQYRQTIHMKPIAVRENGSLLRMVQDWGDGDATTPHIVTRAPLRVRGNNEGMRRFFPVPGDDSKYIEIGAPFIQVGGVWTQVSLGTPSRSGNVMTWTRAQTITTVQFGGHFCKLEIELRNGFVPENSRVAFPVGISGLSRVGTEIRNNGIAVAQLRPFVMTDAANPLDKRPIAHQFANVNGNPFLVLTLPSLTGMVRPVIDPTLSLQPDGTAGIDTSVRSGSPTTNFGTDATMDIGEPDVESGVVYRGFIKFDLSTLPSDATLTSSILSLYATNEWSSNARDMKVYRQKRAWVETQATWNVYSTGNSWSTAGGFHTNDCEQTAIGSRSMSATETMNEFKDIALTPVTKADLDLGNGWLLKMDTETNDAYRVASSDNATAAERPKLEIVYTIPSTQSFVRAPTWGRF